QTRARARHVVPVLSLVLSEREDRGSTLIGRERREERGRRSGHVGARRISALGGCHGARGRQHGRRQAPVKKLSASYHIVSNSLEKSPAIAVPEIVQPKS